MLTSSTRAWVVLCLSEPTASERRPASPGVITKQGVCSFPINQTIPNRKTGLSEMELLENDSSRKKVAHASSPKSPLTLTFPDYSTWRRLFTFLPARHFFVDVNTHTASALPQFSESSCQGFCSFRC
ncbi:hypothetical protein F4824DRAFT_312105 [Ustulina deusta]|nr:hypothetical protein F4824DRAFT_312105 [Ustulina deusta]